MNFLETLPAEKRTLLVSLPYRVGLFISHSDQTGGGASDAAEMEALSGIITGYYQEIFGAETVQYIIGETVSRRAEWDGWSENLDNIDEECRRAAEILSGAVDEKEFSAFKHHLIEIGESVALAFREYGRETPLGDKIKMYLYYLKGKIRALMRGQPYKDWGQFINISMDERKALRRIARALGTAYI